VKRAKQVGTQQWNALSCKPIQNIGMGVAKPISIPRLCNGGLWSKLLEK
jgi:hypothetical protein